MCECFGAKILAGEVGQNLPRFTLHDITQSGFVCEGYGDIVPLTDAARGAVACEAITGIMLIGLFLNALAYERDIKSEGRSSDQSNS